MAKTTKITEDKKTVKTVAKKAVKKENVETTVAVKPTKKGLVTIDVLDTKGKTIETITLPETIFAANINPQLMTQAVRVYLANQRSGTASTKTRGEVRGSTRKIYRQKGTGRARHGGVRAPIFVHGGIAHGPKPVDYSLTLSKKMKQRALFSALTSKLQEGGIKVVAGLEKLEPKTKHMAKTIEDLGIIDKKKKVLLVVPFGQKEEKGSIDWHIIDHTARNIKGVTVVLANQLNTYDVLNTKTLLFMKQSVDSLTRHFLKEE